MIDYDNTIQTYHARRAAPKIDLRHDPDQHRRNIDQRGLGAAQGIMLAVVVGSAIWVAAWALWRFVVAPWLAG